MKLIYETMEINDFKSIQTLRIDFKRPAGLYFVDGSNTVEPELESNGAGKSSIFDALCWMQFDTTPDKLRTPDLIPWGTNKAPSGKLTMLLDGKRHVLTKSSKPGRLTFDNKEITQERLETTLRINLDTFCNTILLPQEHDLFFDRTAGQKLALLSDALQLDRWDKRAETAFKRAQTEEREVNKTQALIDSFRPQIEEALRIQTALKRQAEDWEEEQAKKQEVSEKEIKEWERLLAKATDVHDKASLGYDEAVTELNAIRRELHQLADYIRINDNEIREQKSDINAAQRECNRIREDITRLAKGQCPTCGQALHEKVPKRKELQKTLAGLKGKADLRLIEPLQKANEDLLSRQTNLRRAEEQYAQKAETARTELDAQLPRVAEFKAKIEMGRKQQKETEQIANPFREQLRQVQKQHNRLVVDSRKAVTAWKEHSRRLEQFEFWSRAFRDIKLEIVEEVLQELELCTNGLLPQAGLVGWRIEFAVERETKKGSIARGIDLTILPYKRSADRRVKFANWSGGEAQRLRLVGSISLADVLLRRSGVEPNLQALDEPTRGLSPKGVIHMVEFLAERAATNEQVILLADQTVIESESFSGTFRVKRTQNGTKIQ